MSLIAIEGMEFYAYHGYYARERKIGGFYEIDLYVSFTLNESINDDLDKTVNYEDLFAICEACMKEPAKLIETVAQNTINKIHQKLPMIEHIKIRVSKINPPLPGKLKRTFIEMEKAFEVA